MATGEIGVEELGISMVFALAAAVSVGLFSGDLGFVNLTDSLFTLGEGTGAVEITLAKAVSVGLLGAVFYFNRQDMSSMSGVEYWIVVATGALVLSPVLLPVVDSVISSSTAAGVASLSVQTSGLLALAYAG